MARPGKPRARFTEGRNFDQGKEKTWELGDEGGDSLGREARRVRATERVLSGPPESPKQNQEGAKNDRGGGLRKWANLSKVVKKHWALPMTSKGVKAPASAIAAEDARERSSQSPRAEDREKSREVTQQPCPRKSVGSTRNYSLISFSGNTERSFPHQKDHFRI